MSQLILTYTPNNVMVVISTGGYIHWWSLVVISNGYSILNGHLWWYGGYIHWWYANMVVNQWIWDIPFSDKPNMDIVRIWSDKSCCDLASQRHILKWWLGFGESSPNGRKIFRRDFEPFSASGMGHHPMLSINIMYQDILPIRLKTCWCLPHVIFRWW